jgi:CheY-like chemotaxis protein
MNSEPFHILLADDDEGDRLLFQVAFSELKIKTVVHTVDGGIQLMEWLNMEDTPLPYLIFLDLNMPPKNGLECLKEIKNNEKLKDIFIAIYSTSDNEQDMEETFRNGANVYITKPYDFSILKQVLEKAVETVSKYRDPTMKRENFLLKI